jgi:hypothetical protein
MVLANRLSGPLPAGMALTHDGKLLIVPDGSYVPRHGRASSGNAPFCRHRKTPTLTQ